MKERLSLFDCIDLDEIPPRVDRLSYVRIARGFGGTYGVETLDWTETKREGNGYLKGRERWFGANEGHAMLVAQFFQAKGYKLANFGRPLHA